MPMTKAQANLRLRDITGDIEGYVSRGAHLNTHHNRIDRWYWNDGSDIIRRDYEGAQTLEDLVAAREELMRNDR